jgi:glycosyltransferase involved in cell wall biosynthesis
VTATTTARRMSGIRAVLAHDCVTVYGGSERTLETLFPLFPAAPLFTAVFRSTVPLAHLDGRAVRTSFLQVAPLPSRILKPLFPLAFASLRPPVDTDLILSSSSGYAKGLRHPRALHVAYVHTPIRRAWNEYHRAARRRPRGVLGVPQAIALRLLRRWDLDSMRRVHRLVANSQNTARQIHQIYGRASTVVHPPVRTSYFVPDGSMGRGDYFLVVARLDPYKRVDLAVAAAGALRRPLIVVGDGVERQRLGRQADHHVTFLGRVDDATLRHLYQHCRALVFPGEDDFGIAPVEAQACGRPVVAFAAGGALETVVDGATGVLVGEQTVPSLVAALERLERSSFDPEGIRRHAVQFDEAAFQRRLGAVVTQALDAPRSGG